MSKACSSEPDVKRTALPDKNQQPLFHDNNGDVTTSNQIHHSDGAKEHQEAPVFYPISLPLGDDDDDDDDSTPGTFTKSKQKTPTKNNDKSVPLVLEHAIQDCFRLAITTHDATSVDVIENAVWHWDEDMAANGKQFDDATTIPSVNLEKEEEALRSWVPRPLFLPTWAVQD